MSRRICIGLLLAAAATAEPGRHLNYAESANRLVYAFVFGPRDTCRVIRRRTPPLVPLDALLRSRPGAEYRGEKDDVVLAEVNLPRRPVHLVPVNDGRLLLTFANRAPDGALPAEDLVVYVQEPGRFDRLSYEGLFADETPGWPALGRELPVEPGKPKEPPPLDYLFVDDEVAPGRVLFARESVDAAGRAAEIVCYAVEVGSARVALPEPAEAERLLRHPEELFVAGAAWALGVRGDRAAVAPLKGALAQVRSPGARARVAQALVRCGDEGSRANLRALLKEAPAEAALALAQLPPAKADAEALAAALPEAEADPARHLGIALVRLGPAGLAAAVRLASSSVAPARAAAAAVLARFDDPEAEAKLLRLAREADPSVQTAAAVAITSPPRAIYPANHAAFAEALDACRRAENAKAARRLAMLAAHSEIRHDAVLKALVDMTSFEPKAIWSLQKLTGLKIETPDLWKAWWKEKASR